MSLQPKKSEILPQAPMDDSLMIQNVCASLPEANEGSIFWHGVLHA
jgi:hypothetical protein